MSSLKAITLDLQASTGTTYDQTRTTLLGTAAARTVSGIPVISPPPIKWLDVFTDAAETPFFMDYTINGRAYAITAIAGGLARVMMYTLDAVTGATSYIGKIQLTFPNLAATTHTLRGFKVDDNNLSNIKIFVSTTGTVAINGGTFMAYGILSTDFVQTGFPTLAMATGSAQKAVYFLQDPANIGAGQLNIAAASVSLDRVNQVCNVHNGVSATHQWYLYDYTLTPNVPSQSCTTPIATPGVVNATGHGYNAGDQIQFTGAGLPTGIVAGTTYFVIAAGLTANSFEIAATTGGAAINFTGSSTGAQTVLRAFGITSSLWKWKTGNITALSGVLLNNNSEKFMTPGHSLNSGSPCLFFATTTNLYIVKTSDLTSGQTTPPSLLTANLLGSANQTVAPVAVNAYWNEALDHAIFTTSTTKIIAKKMINNAIEAIFGVLNNDYLEGVMGVGSTSLTQFGAVTVNDLKSNNGWTFILGGSTGQRGIIAKNSGADFQVGTTSIISKVVTLPANSTFIGIAVSGQTPNNSSTSPTFYRTSGFGSATGGWTQLPANGLFSGQSGTQIQFMVQFSMNDPLSSNPEFVIELYLAYLPPSLISDFWAADNDSTTIGTNTPSYVGFIMTQAYSSGTVPPLYLHGTDVTGAAVSGTNLNSTANPTQFQYSTDGGTIWNNLGTIPNVVGTKVRVNITLPPGQTTYMALRES